MQREVIKKIKTEMEKVILFLRSELEGIQAGKASIGLVENMVIEIESNKFKLKELASINCPELRKINIQPWDVSYLSSIQREVLKSPLEMSCSIDGNLLRVTLPTLTEDNRKKIIKLLAQKQEAARIVIKTLREKTWNKAKKEQQESIISENDKFYIKKELQKIVDENNNKIKEIVDRKKKEVMTI